MESGRDTKISATNINRKSQLVFFFLFNYHRFTLCIFFICFFFCIFSLFQINIYISVLIRIINYYYYYCCHIYEIIYTYLQLYFFCISRLSLQLIVCVFSVSNFLVFVIAFYDKFHLTHL